jgi:branched-chain amino acid transport system ATP-binding protein
MRTRALSRRFGGFQALDNVELSVRQGERRLLLGPNGAGKTTLFNLLTGDLTATTGSIEIFGEDVTRLSTAKRVHLGVSRTYQIITLFPQDTVLHNVMLSLTGLRRKRWNPWQSFAADHLLQAEAGKVLERVGLQAMAPRLVASCSYGDQRRLEIAMAIAQQPRLLLLDEPFAGLSQEERAQVQELLAGIPRDIAIVLIEHDMDVALAFADTITLLQHGRVVLEGTRDAVVADPRTREVYLGQ